ncbi:MAG: S41 family peptidase [Candidatus Wildermuthbacteria bacterium]|nr:S41 family peptidase [Candidatus Wildermuthbacteria bacterium]
MKSFSRIFAVSLTVLIIGGAVFGFGFSLGKSQTRNIQVQGVLNLEAGKPEAVDFSLFWETWKSVQDKFVDADALDYQNMVYGAISGMVQSLGDPYSVFFSPEEAKKFLDDVKGMFEGVGMEIGIRDAVLKVVAPLEGTPAQKAGIRAGDMILKIGDAATDNMTVDKAVSLIRGPKGTKIVLSILRAGWDKPRDFSIERAVIEVPSLKWEMKEGNIAYLRIYQFSQKAGIDFQKAANEIISSGAGGIVLDLRNNPGGYLEVSQDIAGWFVEQGKTIVIEDFGPEREQQVYQARGNAAFASWPIVVLINEGSASASEILAGALRDQLNALLVGKTSFGKGSVQELQDFFDNSSLKVTVAHWLTPNGTLIAGKGLKPDVEIDITEENIQQEKDPQLDKALEIVKGL